MPTMAELANMPTVSEIASWCDFEESDASNVGAFQLKISVDQDLSVIVAETINDDGNVASLVPQSMEEIVDGVQPVPSKRMLAERVQSNDVVACCRPVSSWETIAGGFL